MKKSNSVFKAAAKRTIALFLVLFMLFGLSPQIPMLGVDEDGKLAVELVENPLSDLLLQTGGADAELCCENGALCLRRADLAACT